MKVLITSVLLLAIVQFTNAQIDGTLILGLTQVTTSEMNSIINPSEGSILYNTTDKTIYQYNGSSWTTIAILPSDLADGDNDTQYTAGNGLILSGTTLSVDDSNIMPNWDNLKNVPTNLDYDNSNEIQTLSKSGNKITLSDGGGSFTETETTLKQNAGDGKINFSNEVGQEYIANLISEDENNILKVGSDGGALLQTKIIDCYNTASYNLGTSFSTVRINTTRINSSTSVFSLNSSNYQLTINESGVYEVEFTITAKTDYWSSFNAKLQINGADVTASEISNGGWYKDVTASRKLYLTISAGDQLRIQARRSDTQYSGSNDADILANGSSLTIKKLY
jgi:hypothetical protein